MKVLALGLLIVAIAAGQWNNQHRHPLLPYDIIKSPNSNENDAPEGYISWNDYDDLLAKEKCNQQRFQQCIDTYAEELDLDEIAQNSGQFIQDITRIVQEEGLEGLKKECRAGANLKRCLASQFGQCLSEKHLKSIGIEEDDAKVFVTLSVQMSYQCTDGLDAIINNWGCIQTVEHQDRENFKQCQLNYFRKIQEDPNNRCRSTQEMVNCMTGPFQQSCPPAVFNVLCHSMQISIATTLPQCSITCNPGAKSVKSSAEGTSETISSFLARVTLENIPSHQLVAYQRQSWALTGPKCENRRFHLCVNKFVQYVGLPSLPKRAKALAAYLNHLIGAKRAAGFEQVCNAARNMASCLGDQAESCFTTDYLGSLGMAASDLLIYRQIKAGLASECGAGYKAIHDNMECMVTAAQNNSTEFANCASTFERNLKLDPSVACSYAQQYLTCSTDIFNRSCGNDVAAAICFAMRAEIQIPLPSCKNITCIQGANSPYALFGHLPIAVTQLLDENAPPEILIDSSSQGNISTVQNVDQKAECNDRKFGRCLQIAAHQLGLKSFPSDPTEFNKAVVLIITKYGKIGFKKICSIGARLARCLGPEQRQVCITVEHLMELGLTKQQALAYISIAETLQFQCTKGFRVIYENFECIMNVSKSGISTFVNCQKTFEQKVKKDPKHICKYIQEWVDCVVKPFAEGCTRHVGQTVCQSFQAALKPLLPKCSIKCGNPEDDDDKEERSLNWPCIFWRGRWTCGTRSSDKEPLF